MTHKYCVHCRKTHISHKKWNRGTRFCSMECKHNFHKKHYNNSIYLESKRYIKGGLIKHKLQSKELSPGWDVLEKWGIVHIPNTNSKKVAKSNGVVED